MKSVVIVLLFAGAFCLPDISFAQCGNSIEIKRSSLGKSSNSDGVIEVEVNTSKAFTCTLFTQKGSGPQMVQEKKSLGNQIIKFSNLDNTEVYQVVVEFVGEEKLCQKLQKSLITLQ